MPRREVRTFRIRHYECNAYGYLNDANYLRYMQEAAIDASASAGYDTERYLAIDCYWLIRETEIEFLHPLRYGDSVEITTFVTDFRRIRSRRAYEFRLSSTGQMVARAETDWVFLQSSTGRPASIPEEMKTAFFPEGAPDAAPARTRFPHAPAPPPGAFRLSRPVRWQNVDLAQHMNNAMYLDHLEDCGVEAMADRGWPPARMAAAGFRLSGRRHHIEYKQPALLGDELQTTLWLSDVHENQVLRHCTITRAGDGALLAQARTTWACVDALTEQPMRFDEAFMADLAPLTAGP